MARHPWSRFESVHEHTIETDRCRGGHQPISLSAEVRLAGRGSTSFLKRQKEQQRTARAAAKRAARQARRDNRQMDNANDEVFDAADAAEPIEGATEPQGPPPEKDASAEA